MSESVESSSATAADLVFLVMVIFCGGTVFCLLPQRFVKLPYTVLMFLYGMFIGLVGYQINPEVCRMLGSIPPELLFHIFLPVLIFEGSFAMKVHALREVIGQVLLLAGPGLIVNTALLAMAVKWLFFPSWSWYAAALLGSLLSATDPVAVVSLLKGLGVNKRITALVDGEAIMNDGTAIIAFALLVPAAATGTMDTSPSELIWDALRFTVMALLFGLGCGVLQAYCLRRAPSGLIEACITVGFTYVAYFVADKWIETSPVLTMFFQGVYLSYTCPSLFPGTGHGDIAIVWEFLVHLGNTVLFSLVGIILVQDVSLEFPRDLFLIVGFYVVMVLGRFLMLSLFLPFMNWKGTLKLQWRDVVLLTHGGLRGGVAMTLALAVGQVDTSRDFIDGPTFMKLTAGVVFLTLVINATTAEKLVEYLGHSEKEMTTHLMMTLGIAAVQSEGARQLAACKQEPSLQSAQWEIVEQVVQSLHSPYDGMRVVCEPHDKVLNKALMKSFKTALWMLRNDGSIPETVMVRLSAVVTRCLSHATLFRCEDLRPQLKTPKWLLALEWLAAQFPTLSILHSLVSDQQERQFQYYALMLESCHDALRVVQEVQGQYVVSEEDMARVAQWVGEEQDKLAEEMQANGLIRPEWNSETSTKHVMRMTVRAMSSMIDTLHKNRGFSLPLTSGMHAAVEALKERFDEVIENKHLGSDAATMLQTGGSGPAMLSDALSDQMLFGGGTQSGRATPGTTTPQAGGGAGTRSQHDEADAMAALASCPLGKGLHRSELRELLERASDVRLTKGSSYRRTEAFTFFVVVRGVLKCGWAERARGAVMYASRVLPCFVELELNETERRVASTATTWYAESDVTLLVFRATDFCPHLSPLMGVHATSSSLMGRQGGRTGSDSSNSAFEKSINFWHCVAFEAVLPLMDEHPLFQHATYEYCAEALMNGHVIFPEADRSLDPGNASFVPALASTTSPLSFAQPPAILHPSSGGATMLGNTSPLRVTSSEVFFICGGDHSRLYDVRSPSRPSLLPKTLLWQLQWEVDSAPYVESAATKTREGFQIQTPHGHQHRIAAPTVLFALDIKLDPLGLTSHERAELTTNLLAGEVVEPTMKMDLGDEEMIVLDEAEDELILSASFQHHPHDHLQKDGYLGQESSEGLLTPSPTRSRFPGPLGALVRQLLGTSRRFLQLMNSIPSSHKTTSTFVSSQILATASQGAASWLQAALLRRTVSFTPQQTEWLLTLGRQFESLVDPTATQTSGLPTTALWHRRTQRSAQDVFRELAVLGQLFLFVSRLGAEDEEVLHHHRQSHPPSAQNSPQRRQSVPQQQQQADSTNAARRAFLLAKRRAISVDAWVRIRRLHPELLSAIEHLVVAEWHTEQRHEDDASSAALRDATTGAISSAVRYTAEALDILRSLQEVWSRSRLDVVRSMQSSLNLAALSPSSGATPPHPLAAQASSIPQPPPPPQSPPRPPPRTIPSPLTPSSCVEEADRDGDDPFEIATQLAQNTFFDAMQSKVISLQATAVSGWMMGNHVGGVAPVSPAIVAGTLLQHILEMSEQLHELM